jgi:hypothetical protein
LCASAQQHIALHGGDGDKALCASAQQHVASHSGNGNKASCTSAQQHVALHSSNNDKNRGNKDSEVVNKASHSCRVAWHFHIASRKGDDDNNNRRQRMMSVGQQGLVRKRTAY